MNGAGNRDTNSRKNVDPREKSDSRRRKPTRSKDVGAWRGIGGGQGALSQAYEETGVACRPSKQPDYDGLARESDVVRLMSELRNREVEMDLAGSSESCGKRGPTGATIKSAQ